MSDASSLRLALDLLHAPWQARRLRTAPLPKDVQTLLRIAAGEEDAVRSASERTARSRESVTEAAAFFIEQVMLHPEADSFRILGLGPQASYAELRRHMALLLRWLHPDRDHDGERSIFAARVTNAWNDIKTPDRREAYERLRENASTKTSSNGKTTRKNRSKSKKKMPRAPIRTKTRDAKRHVSSRPLCSAEQGNEGGLLRRVLFLLFGRAVH